MRPLKLDSQFYCRFSFSRYFTKLSFSDGVCCLDSYKQTAIGYILNAQLLTIFPMLFKFSSINLPLVWRCLLNFGSK